MPSSTRTRSARCSIRSPCRRPCTTARSARCSIPLSETAVNATPLILAGLSVAVAFRAGLFNIGAQSQLIGGAILATWLGFGVSLPPVIHVIVCVLGAFAGGAALGWIVGFLKARTGAHEVIVTIMLNYVMAYLLSYLLSKPSLLEKPGANGNLISPNIAGDAHLSLLAGTHLRDQRRLPARAGLRGRRVVADEPEHPGL